MIKIDFFMGAFILVCLIALIASFPIASAIFEAIGLFLMFLLVVFVCLTISAFKKLEKLMDDENIDNDD